MSDEEEEGRGQRVKRWMVEEWRSTPWRVLWKALIAELIGSFVLMLFGCGAAVGTDNFGWTHDEPSPDSFSYGDTYHISVALAFGLTTATVVAMFQALSGGHINPAVTLAYMICRRINIVTGVLYVPVQFLGCCGGCGILKLIKATMNNRDDVFPTSVYTEHGMEIWQGLVWETILAFHLCIMYLVVTDDAYPFMSFTSPLLIGTVVVVNHLAALYATGGTANPSRAISAALISWQYFDHLWAFATGPFIGALAAGLFYSFILKEEESEIKQRQFSIFGK